MTGHELEQLLLDKAGPGGKRAHIAGIACTDPFYFDWDGEINLRFDDCIFGRDVHLMQMKAGSEITFSQCLFEDVISITGSHGSVTYKILMSKLLKGMTIEDSEEISLYMGETTGQGHCLFDSAKFDRCSFAGFKFSSQDDDGSMSFFNCIFEKATFKESVLLNARFNHSVFRNVATFDRATLKYTTNVADGNFFSVVFQSIASFVDTNFTRAAQFNSARFMDTAIFVDCNQEQFNCVADFSGCTFERRSFFDGSWFKNLILEQVEFREVASFNRIRCKVIVLRKSVFLQYADFLNAEIENGSRDSFRTIKNEFLRHNNSVEALIYQAKELRIYEREITWRKDPREKFVLVLAKISNDFGVNWLRGIGFTLIAGVLAYLLYLLTLGHLPVALGWAGWHSFFSALNFSIGYFLKFFIVTHSLDFMEKFHPNALSYLIDSLGRILIGYGIYQTIQAFRKYGK